MAVLTFLAVLATPIGSAVAVAADGGSKRAGNLLVWLAPAAGAGDDAPAAPVRVQVVAPGAAGAKGVQCNVVAPSLSGEVSETVKVRVGLDRCDGRQR
ncbi:hypothetical protein ACH4E7_45275 [Kitasatospora sp. NPDC018058]|uniref:hypothetical protein n=1 Tax=Kitasatospora sp. NPDC018058 TaxID=3364025 RepID=UPI0037C067B2